MSLIINGTTNTLTAASGLAIAGNTAITGTLSASGIAAIGGSTSADTGLNIRNSALVGANTYGMALVPTAASGSTGSFTGLFLRTDTAAAAFTVGSAYGLYVDSPSKGAGSAITTNYGIFVASQTAGATNYAFRSAGTGIVDIGDTTDATSTTAASLKTAGGLAVAKKLYVGDVINAVAATTAKASINIPHGAAPTSPVNGDMWTTTAGLFVRINGATVGPLS